MFSSMNIIIFACLLTSSIHLDTPIIKISSDNKALGNIFNKGS